MDTYRLMPSCRSKGLKSITKPAGWQHTQAGEKGTKCIVVCFLRDFLLTSGPLDSSLVSEFKIPRLCFLARMQQIGKVSPPL